MADIEDGHFKLFSKFVTGAAKICQETSSKNEGKRKYKKENQKQTFQTSWSKRSETETYPKNDSNMRSRN